MKKIRFLLVIGFIIFLFIWIANAEEPEKASTIANLQRDLELTKIQLEQVQAKKLQSLQDILKNLQAQLESSNISLGQTKKELEDKEQAIKELKDNLATLQVSFGTQAIEHKQELKSLQDRLGLKSQALKQLQVKLKKIKNTSRRQIAKHKELQVKLKDLESTFHRQANQQQKKLKSLEASLLEKDKTINQQAQTLQSQSQQIDTVSKTTLDNEKTLSDKLKYIADLLAQLQSSHSQIEQLNQSLLTKNSQVKELQDVFNKQAAENESKNEKLRETMDRLQKSLPPSTANEYKAKIDLVQRGLVITLLGDILFNPGSVELMPEGKEILSNISGVLRNAIMDNQIVIEGHTDNVPIKYSRWKSNWELSGARALSVLNYFIYECGLDPKYFSTKGYAEFRPVADNSIPSGRKQNRRVEIIIQP